MIVVRFDIQMVISQEQNLEKSLNLWVNQGYYDKLLKFG